jgi:hypothetical protein
MLVTKEIDDLLFKNKLDWSTNQDNTWVYISYKRENVNLRKIKKLVELSNEFQWWYQLLSNNWKTIVINRKPIQLAQIRPELMTDQD